MMNCRFLLFCFLASLLSIPVLAQNTPRDSTILPELAPREVEILGELEIALPSLQRQPLVGFNPPPQVPEIPADRRPYAEDYLSDQTDLPQSPLSRPGLPEISSLAGLAPINGEFEAGAGGYFSRIVRGRTALPITDATAFYGSIDYEGSDGHVPDDNAPELTSDYDDLSGQLGIQTIFSHLIGGLEADGTFSRYSLFGVASSGSTADFEPNPGREAVGGGGSLWLRTHGETSTDFQARLGYGGSRHETLVLPDGESPPPDFSAQEQRFDLSSSLETAIGNGRLFADVAFASSTFDNDATAFNDLSQFNVGGGFGFLFQRRVNLQLGGRIMGFSGDHTEPLLDGAGADEPALYIAPDIVAEIFPVRGFRLYAQNRPRMESHSLASLFERNPFLVSEPQVLPSVSTINAEGGAAIYLGRLKLAGRVGYEFAPSYLFFEDAEASGADDYRFLSAARYGEAEILSTGGDISFVFPGGVQATVGGAVREGRLTADDTDIPNFGPVIGHAMLAVPFSGSRGLFQAVATYESARYIDRNQSREIGDFFDLDTALFYNFTDALGAVVRVNNISGGYLERWNRHEQPPFVFTGGVRVQW
jgi:hypothetical protein